MFDLDKWEEIWMTMMRHKLRTTLTSFGVFWGIFMLVILLGAGNGLQNGAMQNFDIAKNAVFVWTMPTTVPFAGFDAGRQIEMTNEDSDALSRLAEVKTISPRLQVANRFGDQALSIVRGDESVAFNIMGDYPEFLEIKPYILEEGRFINQLDMDGNRKVAVIGLRVRDELFEPDEHGHWRVHPDWRGSLQSRRCFQHAGDGRTGHPGAANATPAADDGPAHVRHGHPGRLVRLRSGGWRYGAGYGKRGQRLAARTTQDFA